ncbi:hypothetical protein ACI3K5_03785 [Streptomyces sp. MPA0124]|uniref:hypothetical protein n=1 Tax=Streptomyces sp. MPA0124 TaxID=3378069 RepID=UPI003852DE38
MPHQPHLIPELRDLPPEDGWPRAEATGRACTICQCGLNTGFVDSSEAIQSFNAHGAEVTAGHAQA